MGLWRKGPLDGAGRLLYPGAVVGQRALRIGTWTIGRVDVALLHNVPVELRALVLDAIAHAFEVRGHRCEILEAEDLLVEVDAGGVSVRRVDGSVLSPDAVLSRVVARPPLRLPLFALAASGATIVNSPVASERTADKLRTAMILTKAGVPVVPTTLAQAGSDWPVEMAEAHLALGRLVVKPVRGMWGDGMHLIDTSQELADLRSQQPEGCPWLLQPFIGDPEYGDLRVFVAGDRVVTAMRRIPGSGEWRANLHKGGDGVAHDPTLEEVDIALRACRAVGLDVAGVDLVVGQDGPRVLELNSNPGFVIGKVTGVDLAGPIAKAVEDAWLDRHQRAADPRFAIPEQG